MTPIGSLGLPQGWFAVAFSAELPPGSVLARHYFGQELVVFRTRSGAVCVMDAYCPHLGAHLGHGGEVAGETLRCPFHHFCFDTCGDCVSTPYATKIPPKAKVHVWPVQELHGGVFVYYDAGGTAPSWEIPDRAMDGWTRPRRRTFTLRGHPQDTTENGVDLGHLGVVHGYQAVEVLQPLHTDGPHLSVRYAMRRAAGPFGLPGQQIRAEFAIHTHGLGYSFVDTWVPALQLHTRQFVWATPIDRTRLDLRVSLSLEDMPQLPPVGPLLRLAARAGGRQFVAQLAWRTFLHDLQQDFPMWERKQYVDPPALAEGDGPIGPYRRWARQFYPQSPPVPAGGSS